MLKENSSLIGKLERLRYKHGCHIPVQSVVDNNMALDKAIAIVREHYSAPDINVGHKEMIGKLEAEAFNPTGDDRMGKFVPLDTAIAIVREPYSNMGDTSKEEHGHSPEACDKQPSPTTDLLTDKIKRLNGESPDVPKETVIELIREHYAAQGDVSTGNDEAAKALLSSPATNTPQSLPEPLASKQTESELTDEGHGRMVVAGMNDEIPVVDEAIIDIIENTPGPNHSADILKRLRPYLRTTEPDDSPMEAGSHESIRFERWAATQGGNIDQFNYETWKAGYRANKPVSVDCGLVGQVRRRFNALRLEVDTSIVDDVENAFNDLMASLIQPAPKHGG